MSASFLMQLWGFPGNYSVCLFVRAETALMLIVSLVINSYMRDVSGY